MKTKRSIFYFLLALMIGAIGLVSNPQGVSAQSCDPASDPSCVVDTPGPTCGLPGLPDCAPDPTATNQPTAKPPTAKPPTYTPTATFTATNTATSLPCVSGGSGLSNRPDCTPTPTPPCVSGGSGLSTRPECTKTPTPPCYSGSSSSSRVECTRVPTATSQAVLNPGNGSDPANPNGLLPAVQNLGPLSGGLLAGSIIAIIGLGGFFLVERRRKLGSANGSDLLPAVQRDGSESAVLNTSVVGDVSPEGTIRPPGPPVKPNDILRPPGPPNMPDEVLLPPGPPTKLTDTLLPPGPPNMPNGVEMPPGPPIKPTDAVIPPGPPDKPPNPNFGG